MSIYAKKITPAQRAWLANYETETGFEPMYQEDLDDGAKSFYEVMRLNINWYESHTSDVHLRISAFTEGLTETDLGADHP